MQRLLVILCAVLLAVAAVSTGSYAGPAGAQVTPKDPVVIVPGTGVGEPLIDIDLDTLSARLRADGYEVFFFYLPGSGYGDFRDTAAHLPAFVDGVLAETGATRVDLVGHSQGGILSRYYVKFLGGDAKVDSLVSMGSAHYGTQLVNLVTLYGLWTCLDFALCRQVTVGSEFLNELNAGDDTPGDVQYTSISTMLDEIVVPYTNAFLKGENNTNVTVQHHCPLRVVEHIALVWDGAVYDGIRDALAKRPITLDCLAL